MRYKIKTIFFSFLIRLKKIKNAKKEESGRRNKSANGDYQQREMQAEEMCPRMQKVLSIEYARQTMCHCGAHFQNMFNRRGDVRWMWHVH